MSMPENVVKLKTDKTNASIQASLEHFLRGLLTLETALVTCFDEQKQSLVEIHSSIHDGCTKLTDCMIVTNNNKDNEEIVKTFEQWGRKFLKKKA